MGREHSIHSSIHTSVLPSFFLSHFCIRAITPSPFAIFSWHLVYYLLGQDTLSPTRMTSQYFLSYLLCSKLKIRARIITPSIFYTFMRLGIYTFWVKTMCLIQKWKFFLSYFLSYVPFSKTKNSYLDKNILTVWDTCMIFGIPVGWVKMMCRVQEWHRSLTHLLNFPVFLSQFYSWERLGMQII